MADNIGYIRKTVSRAELLAQLGEEAAELAQAALKLRRAMTGDNPTPKRQNEARFALLEEIADVELCMWALELETAPDDLKYIGAIMEQKCARWAARLKETRGEKPNGIC